VFSILYVDDEPELLDIGRLFLEQGGQFSVETITSAPAALSRLDVADYDAIVSDYMMPEMDGIELLKKVRTSGNTVPFILFTGRGREEVVIQALNEGADFYLQKGGDPEAVYAELSHKIRQAIQRRLAESAVRDHERREMDIINFLPDATFAINTHGEVIAWNRAIEEMTGIPARLMLGKGNYEYAIPLYGERRPILIDLVFEPSATAATYYPTVKKNGSLFIVETVLTNLREQPLVVWGKASPLFDTRGNIIGAIETIRDITERRRAEELLEKSRENYLTVLDNIPDFVVVHRDGVILYVNPALLEAMGVRADDVLGRPALLEFVAPEHHERVASSIRKRMETGRDEPYEADLISRQNERRTVSVRGANVEFDGIPATLAVMSDITGQKRTEETLRQANRKLKLLSGITRHDISNQLTTLRGHLALLKKNQPEASTNEHFEKMNKSAERIFSIIQFTREYEEIGVHVPAWQAISPGVDAAARGVNLGPVVIRNEISPLTEIFADPMIVKAFSNLIDNAVRYGGKIRAIRFSEEGVGNHLKIVCEDDGDGISQDDKEKIFGRGFGRNTGLGLFLVREVLGITGITIQETGEPGKGARFEMTVPEGAFRSSGAK